MTTVESEDGGEASFLKQFSPGKWPDDMDDKSIWLYSCNCNVSPSSCLSFGVGDCLASLQSISENSELLSDEAVTLFDGSRVSPIEEASMLLHENKSDSKTILQEDMKGDEIVTWLITSNRDDFSDSSTCSEISDSFLSMSLEDDSSSQFSIDLDSPCLPHDTDRTGFSLPLINLDGEDSNWLSDAQSEIDLIHSDFPSPSYKKSWGFEIHSSGSSVSPAINMRNPKSKCITTCFDEASEAIDLAEYSPDTPLFWPLSEKSDWSSDVTLDFLVMSPRNKHNLLSSTGSSHRSFRFRIHQGRKKEMGNNFRRRLVFGSASNILEFNCRNGKRKVRRSSTTPSKFTDPKRCQVKAPPQSKADTVDYRLLKKSVELSKKDFSSSVEDTIETIMGLDEFNGHEGIESEFDKDDFSLDEDL